MSNSNILLHDVKDIEKGNNIYIHRNAFIKPDGTFYLANGYTGCNPHHQIEGSALSIGRLAIGPEFANDFKKYYEALKADGLDPKYLHYFRTILVHYYGYALFCRKEVIKAFNDRNKYTDHSVVPNSEYYGKSVTDEQIATLEVLYDLNDDGTLYQPLIPYRYEDDEFIPSRVAESRDEVMSLILKPSSSSNSWHR